MLCCLVAGSVMAVVFRIRLWLTRRRPRSLDQFAPPARRSAAGEALPPRAPTNPRTPSGRGHRALSAIAAGMLSYLAVIAGLLSTGLAHSTADTTMWAVRTTLWLTAAATLCPLAWRQSLGRQTRAITVRERVGGALAGIGLAWFVLGVVDMHLFGAFALGAHSAHGAMTAHHVSTWWDVVFHSSGAALAVAGWLTLPVRPLDEDNEPGELELTFATSAAQLQGSVP